MAWPTADHKMWMLQVRGEQIARQVSGIRCGCSSEPTEKPRVSSLESQKWRLGMAHDSRVFLIKHSEQDNQSLCRLCEPDDVRGVFSTEPLPSLPLACLVVLAIHELTRAHCSDWRALTHNSPDNKNGSSKWKASELEHLAEGSQSTTF